MTWVAVLRLIGGWRAAAFLALAIGVGVLCGIQTVRLNATQTSYDGYKDRVIAATAKAAKAAATARDASHIAREAYYWKSGEAENAYQAGRDSAIQAQAVLVSDLRSGIVRLRNEWRGCGVREGGPATGTTQGPDEEADLRAEGAGNLVRAAADADNQVIWLQAELTATRELYSKCMVPKVTK